MPRSISCLRTLPVTIRGCTRQGATLEIPKWPSQLAVLNLNVPVSPWMPGLIQATSPRTEALVSIMTFAFAASSEARLPISWHSCRKWSGCFRCQAALSRGDLFRR